MAVTPIKTGDNSYETSVTESLNAIEASILNPYSLEVAKGDVVGVRAVDNFGRNPDIDTASGIEDVWALGGIYSGFPSEVETMEAFSSDANDTLLGTGARTITFTNLLDGSFNEMPDITIDLDGVTPVSLGAQTYSRCTRAFIATAGSGGANAGSITLRHTTTTANIFMGLPIGANQTQVMAYTVPAGKTLYITNYKVALARASGAAGSANISLNNRVQGGVFRAIRTSEITDGHSYYFNGGNILKVTEKSDLKVSCLSVSDNNTIITSDMDGYLVDN